MKQIELRSILTIFKKTIMKPIIIAILILSTVTSAYAQVAFRTYHTKDNKETKNMEEALYVRELTLTDGQNAEVLVTEKYLATNKIKLYGHYNNIRDKKFIGPKLQAYSNGKIKAKEKFSADAVLIDTAEYYHPNGKLRLAYYYPYKMEKESTKVTDTLVLVFRDSLGQTHLSNGDGYAELYDENNTAENPPQMIEKGSFKNHKRTGQWTGYFLNKKYTFEEEYDNGKIVTGVSRDSTNTTYPYTESNYMVQPSYPGDIITLRRFIANNFSFPKQAISQRVNGTIIVSFSIDSSGNMVDLKINKSLGLGTDEEAIRVLKRAKHWSPGIMRGVPVKVAYTLPIRLNIK